MTHLLVVCNCNSPRVHRQQSIVTFTMESYAKSRFNLKTKVLGLVERSLDVKDVLAWAPKLSQPLHTSIGKDRADAALQTFKSTAPFHALHCFRSCSPEL
jgi:hypothetical protein